MDCITSRLHPRSVWTALAASLAILAGTPAHAAVAILSNDDAPELVLVDADKLDTPLLQKLVTAGFTSPTRFETGCEITDAGLLADRLGRAKRVIALLSAADADLVQSLLQEQGRSLRSLAAPLLGSEAAADLLALRNTLGELALPLRAIETIVPR